MRHVWLTTPSYLEYDPTIVPLYSLDPPCESPLRYVSKSIINPERIFNIF